MGVYYGMNGLWVPVGGQGGAAPVDPNLLAENIKSGVTISGVTGTFTNDGTATASDILTGKTSYVNGGKVTGTMKNLSGGWSVQNLMPTYDTSLSSIKLQHTNSVQGYFPANTSISYYSSISNFGNATASDVASGKTFTSSAGLKVLGTGSSGGGATVTNVITVSPKSSSIGIPCSKKPKGVTVFRDLFKSTTEATETTTAITVTVLSYHEDTTTIASGGFNVKSGLCSVGTQAYSDIISGVTYSGGLLSITLTSPHYFKGDYIAILYY